MKIKRKVSLKNILILSLFIALGFLNSCSDKHNSLAENESAKLPRDGFIYRQGDQLLLDGNPIKLRGVCFSNFFWEEKESLYRSHHNEADFEKLKSMNMNVVRFYLMASMFEDPGKPYVYPEKNFEWLEKNIEWARKNGIYLILDMHGPPGGYQSEGDGLDLWENRENQLRLLALWKHIAKRYRDEPVIAGYDLLNEPVVSKSRSQWERLAGDIVKEIRTVDKNHLLIVANTMKIKDKPLSFERYRNFFLVDDKNVLYTFHFYYPIEYTHQDASWTNFPITGNYPDETKTNLTLMNPFLRYVIKRNKKYLEYEVKRMARFGLKNNVPMYVGEFGAYIRCFDDRGGLQWLDDTLSLFDKYGLHYTWHSYHESGFGFYTNYTGFPNPAKERTEITEMFTRYLSP